MLYSARRFTRTALAGSAVLLIAAVAAACGSSASNTSSPSSSSSSSSALSPSAKATLQARLNSYQAVPKFVAPGPAIDVGSLRGKKVYVIPENGNSFNNSIVGVMKTIAKQAGIKMTVYENSGVSSQYVQGMQSAIAQKPSLIILANAPDPRGLQPQIAAAKAAGIPVEVTHFYDDSTPPPPACAGCAAGVTSLETAKFNLSAKLMADWVILHSDGRADVLIPILLGVIPTPGMEAVFKAEFSKYCPSCKAKYINVPAAAFGTSDFSNSVEASISGDPNLNWVLEQFDPVVPSIVSSIATAGRTGKVTLSPTPAILQCSLRCSRRAAWSWMSGSRSRGSPTRLWTRRSVQCWASRRGWSLRRCVSGTPRTCMRQVRPRPLPADTGLPTSLAS